MTRKDFRRAAKIAAECVNRAKRTPHDAATFTLEEEITWAFTQLFANEPNFDQGRFTHAVSTAITNGDNERHVRERIMGILQSMVDGTYVRPNRGDTTMMINYAYPAELVAKHVWFSSAGDEMEGERLLAHLLEYNHEVFSRIDPEYDKDTFTRWVLEELEKYNAKVKSS